MSTRLFKLGREDNDDSSFDVGEDLSTSSEEEEEEEVEIVVPKPRFFCFFFFFFFFLFSFKGLREQLLFQSSQKKH